MRVRPAMIVANVFVVTIAPTYTAITKKTPATIDSATCTLRAAPTSDPPM